MFGLLILLLEILMFLLKEFGNPNFSDPAVKYAS
jgi:hypothetical protein